MACYRPLTAWQLEGGEIVFSERGDVRRQLELPCGRCIGCRSARARAWAIRCMHEAQMHEVSSFVTLTYDDEHSSPSLNYSDFQRFMYRVRQKFGPTRFFVCGEYGELNQRPHFHALLFGCGFPDRVPFGKGYDRSAVLEGLWRFGFSSVGDVNYASAGYCAQYSCSKVTGPLADAHYCRVDTSTGEYVYVVPEFGHMSLKPGIGYSWFQKYWREVYGPRDGVVLKGGLTVPPPRYYDNLLLEMDGELRDFKDYGRYTKSKQFADDCTPERLAVREHVHKARNQFNKRRYL